MRNYTTIVTIFSGESLSSSVRINEHNNLAIQIPVSWTDASLTFQGCNTKDGTYGNIHTDDGKEVKIPVNEGDVIVPDMYKKVLKTFVYLKIRSGTSSDPVAQTADRTITIYLTN